LSLNEETQMKSFLAAGDVLLNPQLLAYAVVENDSEGQQLRLGLVGTAGGGPSEMLLTGLEARSVIRWLRTNAEYLDAGGPSFRRGPALTPVVSGNTDVKASGRARVDRAGVAS
jgi:hypothetical protein